MRSCLLFQILTLCALPIFGQQITHDRGGPSGCHPDSVLQYSLGLTLNDSFLFAKSIWRYSDTCIVRYDSGNDPFTLLTVDSTVIDAQGRPLSNHVLAAPQMTPQKRFLYFPHGASNQNDSVYTYEIFSSSTGIELSYKALYFFDTNDKKSELQYFSWDKNIQAWYPTLRETYEYTPTGKLAQQRNDAWGGSWNPQFLQTYTYDSNDSLILEYWSYPVGNIPAGKVDYFYNQAEHNILRKYYSWDNFAMGWLYQNYLLEDFDALGRYEVYETRSPNNIYTCRTVYTYIGTNDCPFFTTDYSWYIPAGWLYNGRHFYFPNGKVDTQEPIGKPLQWSAYPNPAEDWIWLEAPIGSPVRLTNLKGQILYTGFAKGKERIPLGAVQGPLLLSIGDGKNFSSRIITVNH